MAMKTAKPVLALPSSDRDASNVKRQLCRIGWRSPTGFPAGSQPRVLGIAISFVITTVNRLLGQSVVRVQRTLEVPRSSVELAGCTGNLVQPLHTRDSSREADGTSPSEESDRR